MKTYEKNAIRANVNAEICANIDEKIERLQNSIEEYTGYLNEEMAKPEDERSDWRITDYKHDIEEYTERIAAMQKVIDLLCK